MIGHNIHALINRLLGNTPAALLARGGTAGLTVRVLGMLSGILLHLLLARSMGAASYGVYAYAFNWLFFLQMFCTPGFGQTIVRFAPAYRSDGQWALLRGLLRTGTQVGFASGLLLSLVVSITVFALGDQLSTALRITLYVGCSLFPMAAVAKAWQGALRAFNRVFLALFPLMLLHRLLQTLFVVALLVVNAKLISPPGVMSVNVASMGIVVCLLAVFKRQTTASRVPDAAPDYRRREWLTAAFTMLLVAASEITHRRAGILFIGAILQTRDVGVYAISARLTQPLVFGIAGITLALGPLISQLFAQGRTNALQKTVTLATRGAVLYVIPLGILILVFGEPMLDLFGKEFTGGYAALFLLVAAECACATIGPVGELLLMTGHHGDVAAILGVGAIVNVILNVTLVPLMGIEGAAAASLASLVGTRLVLLVQVRRRLDINPTLFSSWRKLGKDNDDP